MNTKLLVIVGVIIAITLSFVIVSYRDTQTLRQLIFELSEDLDSTTTSVEMRQIVNQFFDDVQQASIFYKTNPTMKVAPDFKDAENLKITIESDNNRDITIVSSNFSDTIDYFVHYKNDDMEVYDPRKLIVESSIVTNTSIAKQVYSTECLYLKTCPSDKRIQLPSGGYFTSIIFLEDGEWHKTNSVLLDVE